MSESFETEVGRAERPHCGACDPWKMADGVREWRVSRPIVVLKGAGTVAGALLALTAGSPQLLAFAIVITVAMAGLTLRDLLAPVRVAADDEAVTVVTGYVGHQRIPWAEVERIRVDERRRLGRLTEYLEIDSGDMVHLYSRYELDAQCGEVAESLRRYTQMAQ